MEFAPQKTNAIIITKKLYYDNPELYIGGIKLTLVDKINILGVTIESKLIFQEHITNTCRKALNIYKQITKTAKISWGLSTEITKTMYIAITEPIVMYAATVWHGAVEKINNQKKLNTVQRGFAQMIARTYKTVSLSAAMLLAGLLPLDLRIKVYAVQNKKRETVGTDSWQTNRNQKKLP